MADSVPTTKRVLNRGPRSPAVDITVTREIIDAAIPRDSQHCMIAETIAQQIPGSASVMVDTATIRWTNPDKGLRYIFLTPRSVREAIFKFDDGEPLEPFSFHLRSAQVRGVRPRDGAKKRMTSESWERVKESIKKTREEKDLKWTDIAKEMNVPVGTLTKRLGDNDIPTAVNANKMEKWVRKHTGEKPAPRAKLQTNRASGPARVRDLELSERPVHMEIIGGGHPPIDINLTQRQYGLRKLRTIWRTPS